MTTPETLAPTPDAVPAPTAWPESPRCAYIRGNGLICGGYALNNSRFCFHHSRTQQTRRVLSDVSSQRRYEFADGNRRTMMSPNAQKNYDDLSVHLFQALELPSLTDASSCLVALDAVAQALGTQQISVRAATVLRNIIRTAIMLHQQHQAELAEAEDYPEQRVEENPVRPPHHMTHGYSYNADGDLEPSPTELNDQREDSALRKEPASTEPEPELVTEIA
jgi:hypothetical protein